MTELFWERWPTRTTTQAPTWPCWVSGRRIGCGSDMPRAGATLTTPQGHSPHFLVFFYDFIAIFGCWMCRKKRGWGSNWEGRGLNWVHRRWLAIVWDIHVLSSLYITHPQWYRIKPDRYTSGLWRDFDIVGQKTGLLVWKIFTRVC